MENQAVKTSAAFNVASWIALMGGIAAYLLGLWNAQMQLNEKGYYFAILVLGLFAAISLQKTVRDRIENVPTTALYYGACLAAFVVSVALLLIGLWNAELLLSEKGFYGLAFFLCVYGAIAVQKNVRDSGTRLLGQPRDNPDWVDEND